MPAHDLSLLIDAARQAGDIARSYWRRTPRAWDKPEGAGPVTEADLAVDAWLSRYLRAARPDYGWLSEESTDDLARLDASRCFIVDPIDGTRAFIDGQEGFAQAIAVAEHGKIIAGVVHLPVRGETYAATLGGGATLNGAALVPNDGALDGGRLMGPKTCLDAALWHGEVPDLKRVFRPSLAWRLCLVAAGRAEVAMTLRPAWEWDIAAGTLIASEAGCTASDRNGGALQFNVASAQTNGLIIAGPERHREILTRLRREAHI